MTGTILVTCPIESPYPHICKHSELNRLIFEPLTENPTQFCNQIKRLTTSDSAKRAARYLVDPTEHIQEALGIVDRALPLHAGGIIRVSEFAPRSGALGACRLCKKRPCPVRISKDTVCGSGWTAGCIAMMV